MHRRKVLAGLGALSMPVLPIPARAAPREATPATFARVVEEMAGGGELLLAGGDYGKVRIQGEWPASSPLVIRSRDRNDPARFAELGVVFAQNLRLEGLACMYRYSPGNATYYKPFQVSRSQNIVLHSCLFHGDLAPSGSGLQVGFATGYGLHIRDTTRVTVESCELRRFERGIVLRECADTTLRGNDLHSLRMDGVTAAQVDGLVILGNHLHDFTRNIMGADHSDMIQFWTAGTSAPTRNVLIRGNLLNSGEGWYTQSIFMRNELVDTGQAGSEMLYRDVEISDNVILNAHLHGITVGETQRLIVSNNTVVRNARSEGPQNNPPLWEPRISVAQPSRDVIVARNVTSQIDGYSGQSDWRVLQNLLVQDRSRLQPGFYGTVFNREAMSDPTEPSSFAPLSGGPLDGAGIGASWLDLTTTGPPKSY